MFVLTSNKHYCFRGEKKIVRKRNIQKKTPSGFRDQFKINRFILRARYSFAREKLKGS